MQNNYENNIEIKKLKKSKKGVIAIVFLLLVIIGLVGYILYDKGIIFKQESSAQIQGEANANSSENKTDEKISLDIKSGLVQGLYNLVNYDAAGMNWKEKNGTTAEDMSYLEKFSLAIQQVHTENLNCLNYKSLITNIYGTDSDIICGDSSSIEFNPLTKQWEDDDKVVPYAELFKEEDIKNAMYQIFGKDYYEKKDKLEEVSFDYLYIAEEKGYIRVHLPRGGIKPLVTETLKSAELVNDEIILTADGQSDKKFTIIYTFKYNNDDRSYYFNKIDIK